MLQRLDCSKLEVFELASVEILGSQIDHAAFQKFLQRCKCLKQLTLCVTGAGSTPIIDIQLPKSMETIGITHAVQIDWNTLTSCDKLQSVKISNEKTPKIIGNMEDALIKGENMKKFELNVANQPITEQILAAVCAQHPKLKRLRGRFDPRINDWSPIAKLTKLQDLEIKMDSNVSV